MNRVRTLYRQMSEYHKGKTRLSTLPYITEIEVTNNCNLHCRFCAREAIQKHRGLGFMSLEQVKILLEKCRGHLLSPTLSMHGEPTLHPDLPEFVRLVKKAGARAVCFTTNGTLLDENKYVDLLDAGIDGIEVSFEGTDKENYEYQRVGSRFGLVYNNLLNVADLNRQIGFPVNLGINIIDSKLTHDKIPEFKRFWEEKGVRVDVGLLNNWCNASDPEFFKENAREESFNHPFTKFHVCPVPWFFAGVDYNGWVVPCCHWFGEPMGDIFTQSLEEIWNGPKYVQFREQMVSGGRHEIPFCSNCMDGALRPDSPFFQEPNRLFPLSFKLFRNAWTFLKWGKGKYKPSREL